MYYWNSSKLVMIGIRNLLYLFQGKSQSYSILLGLEFSKNNDFLFKLEKIKIWSQIFRWDCYQYIQTIKISNQQGDQKSKHLKSLRTQQEDLKSDVGSEAYLARRITEKSAEYDLRAIDLIRMNCYRQILQYIANTTTIPKEKQMVEVIQLYPHFKIGEIWRESNMIQNKPTSDDYH